MPLLTDHSRQLAMWIGHLDEGTPAEFPWSNALMIVSCLRFIEKSDHGLASGSVNHSTGPKPRTASLNISSRADGPVRGVQ
jgi:hypothetical protein